MQDYEKLGVFYLGKEVQGKNNELTKNLLLYESKDLTTHAVCLGMTGSGKTGLCISLLEEAAIDNIPALIIDPKGDMTNLALQFPSLTAEEFRPWINVDEASKKGLSEEAFAQEQADLWAKGLASWDQSGERIRRLQEAAEVTIYTPGSTSGVPVSILNSFAAPPAELVADADSYNERISTTVASLLGLMGIDADPLQSREHILLSTILNHYWVKNTDIDLATLIHAVQAPPVDKIGFLDLEAFYPAKERFQLAAALNNLMAAPAFQAWLQGEALDVSRLLYTDKGKPRLAIMYIAHLSDAERMFFLALLLNQVLAWVRRQAGTSSLRAILYFDEIFGYLPPTSNPPSKKPLLTLLKQARAFGLGVVLATQNPVDLDYKALANIGTWFIGRLQTEQDRARVLDGLSVGIDARRMDDLLAGLGKRVFLMHNVHDDKPVLFYSRWALSYLRGPLTRQQIREMAQPAMTSASRMTEPTMKSSAHTQPILPGGIKSFYLPMRNPAPADSALVYRPRLYASVLVHYFDGRKGIDLRQQIRLLTDIANGPMAVQWENGQRTDIVEADLLSQAEEGAHFESLSAAAADPKSYKGWEADLKDFIYRSEKLALFKSAHLKMTSNPEESERDFRSRLAQEAREQRDEWAAKLRDKYAAKIAALERRIRSADDKLYREQEQAKQLKLQTALNVGSTLLGAFLGRKAVSRSTMGRAGSAMRSAGRMKKETGDVNRAEDNLEALQTELKELQNRFQEELDAGADKFSAEEELETMLIRPNKSSIDVQLLCCVWAPYWKLHSHWQTA
ncbi:DUF87 domain-containing protein [candidate division KSB1 bacterium]|nr:DUF87 domain-containing protein [candidate division KSB1 bacterium]RQW01732.1 MAG: DUF87 domain-containing protein [candidate division KSB1 bacterium]